MVLLVVACGCLWLFFVGCGVACRFQMSFVVLPMASEEGVKQRGEEKVGVRFELGGAAGAAGC